MVRYASESRVAEKIELITNALLLTRTMSEALIDAGLTQIRMSIYGLSTEKYREMCGADVDFDAIVANVRGFHDANLRRGRPTRVYVKTMDCALNGREDEERFKALFGEACDIYAVESVVPNVQGVDYSTWLKGGTPRYNALGVNLPEIRVCPQPYHLITICPDGRVVPCSNESMMGIGDCGRQTLADIWRGDLLRQCQVKMLDGSKAFGGVCATCAIVQCRPFPEDILDNDVEALRMRFAPVAG
jgi:MoaA/NifB/PqqE/SkfB family radical SAM enzyme